MEVDPNLELESVSTMYESTTTIDSEDDETNSSTNISVTFASPNVHRLAVNIRDINYSEFAQPFQARLIAISVDGTQEDLLNFLDIFWEKVKQERTKCFTKSAASRYLCRRINHILLAVRDIFKHLAGIYSNPDYFFKMSRILAVYMDLELKASSKGTEFGLSLVARMQQMLCSHLQLPNHHLDNDYILLTFIHMERLGRSHKELVDILFNRFVKPPFLPKELSDRMYITYLVLYKKWIDIESTHANKSKLTDTCVSHVIPSKRLRTNLKYAPYLPRYSQNENPTLMYLKKKFNTTPLIEALKIPDNEDNSDIEIIDVESVNQLQVGETPSHDSTVSITQIMSSTSISNDQPDNEVNATQLDEDNDLHTFQEQANTSPQNNPGTSKSFPVLLNVKQECEEIISVNVDGIIDLTDDEVDVEIIDDNGLSWINNVATKGKYSLMLPPQLMRPPIDSIVIDDDDETEESKTTNPNINKEKSDNKLCNCLNKSQSIEISTNIHNHVGPTTSDNTKSFYSITSPTDSGINMAGSGRNSGCSLFEDELAECGLIFNDEQEAKSNHRIRHNTATIKTKLTNKDAESTVQTDSEIENLPENASKNKNSNIVVPSDNSDIVINSNNTNVDKINNNCDELDDKNPNNGLIQDIIEPELKDHEKGETNQIEKSSNDLRKIRCNLITKTYQSNKKSRSRILTPIMDDVYNTNVASSIVISPNKPDITLDEEPVAMQTLQTKKPVQTSTLKSSANKESIVFSMLPRQKPNVLSSYPSPSTNTTDIPSTSGNVVFSTNIPTTVPESLKSVSTSIINDWEKLADDELFPHTNKQIDSDIEEEERVPLPSNILIRCQYLTPISTRSNSPIPMPIADTKILASPKRSPDVKIMVAPERSPAGGRPFFKLEEYLTIKDPINQIRRPFSNKRVGFSNAVVEYRAEKVEDVNSDLKLRFKKQLVETNAVLPNKPLQKSILKKQIKPKPCSVVLNKIPSSNEHVGDYLKRIEDDSNVRVASILIRRNSIHSTTSQCDKKDDGYTVWRRDYTTDYDDAQTEQRKTHKKKKQKRKRSRVREERSCNKKQKQSEVVQPLQKLHDLSVVVAPLKLGQLIVDPEVNIQFVNELETDNEIYSKFELNAHKNNCMSSRRSSIESLCAVNFVNYNANKEAEPKVINETNFIAEYEFTDDEDMEDEVPNKQELKANKTDLTSSIENVNSKIEYNANKQTEPDIINETNFIAEEKITDDEEDMADEVLNKQEIQTNKNILSSSIAKLNSTIEYNAANKITEPEIINKTNFIAEEEITEDEDMEDEVINQKKIKTNKNSLISIENLTSTIEYNTNKGETNETNFIAEERITDDDDMEGDLINKQGIEIIKNSLMTPIEKLASTIEYNKNKDIEPEKVNETNFIAEEGITDDDEDIEGELINQQQINTNKNSLIPSIEKLNSTSEFNRNKETEPEIVNETSFNAEEEVMNNENMEDEIENKHELKRNKNILISSIEKLTSRIEYKANKEYEPEVLKQTNIIVDEKLMDTKDVKNNVIFKQEIYTQKNILISLLKQNMELSSAVDRDEKNSGNKKIESEPVGEIDLMTEKEATIDQTTGDVTMNEQNTQEEIMAEHNMEEEVIEEDDIEEEIMIDPNTENEDMEDQYPIDEDELLKDEEVFTSEADSIEDEHVVSTTHDIQEEIETEIIEEQMEHEIIQDTNASPADDPEIKDKEMTNEPIPESQQIVILQTPENEQDQLNMSGSSDEISDKNNEISENIKLIRQIFVDKLNASDISNKTILLDTNTVDEVPKSVEQLSIIDRMLCKKPTKVLRANSCLDEINDLNTSTESVDLKNDEGKNARDSSERDNEIQNELNKDNIMSKMPLATTGEDEFLIEEEYIEEQEEIVIPIANEAELSKHRSEGDQSCGSEEIPSPPFETVVPKIKAKVAVVPRRMKLRGTSNPHSNEDAPIESPPFDEVLDLKSFGTLENDSSISEMENVGKRVNENFNEIDEEEENESDIRIGKQPTTLKNPNNEINTSNQNDVTTTTTMVVQKKKNLVQRPYNRHIKINNKKRNSSSNSSSNDIPETIVSSTTITSNHLVAIANKVEYTGTNNSSTTYNLFCQLNNDDYSNKKRRGRPKGSKNKRKEYTPSQIPKVRSDLFPPTPAQLSPPLPIKPMQCRQSIYYQHNEIASSSSLPHTMVYNNNPPYRPPYKASEESLNQINRHRSLPIPPFNRPHRVNFRTPSCDSDELPLIHFKHHQSTSIVHHGYDRKHKKPKRNDSETIPFGGLDKNLLDPTKTYMKVQEARTIFVPEDVNNLIQNQTMIDPGGTARSSVTSTYHRYDPGGGGGSGVAASGISAIKTSKLLNNSYRSGLSDPITQSHQFVNYDTSSSPERIVAQHEHNYSNDSFPHQLPHALLNTTSLDYLHLPYLLTAQQQFKTPLQYIHR